MLAIKERKTVLIFLVVAAATLLFPSSATPQPQLSLSAYRALGQVDLRENGVNMVGPNSLSLPEAVAVDRDGHLYVTDTGNQRVVAWPSVTGFQNGDPAVIVLGQPNFLQSNLNGIGAKGFNLPWGLAADPITGNLYVADYGNNRVLRFPKPFANPTRVEPDAVYGQPDFTTRSPNTAGISAHSMFGPRAVAFDSQGNLWVADTGNHRILHFPAGVLNNPNPSADFALGQPDLHSSRPNAGGQVGPSGFNTPAALAFDSQDNLYVADFLNTRVLKFPSPVAAASAASVAYGEPDLKTRGTPQVPTSSSMNGPTGVVVDSKGGLYVAVPVDNRVLVFPPKAASGAAATTALGQPDLTTVTANTGAFPQSSATSLFGVGGLALDADGNLLTADSNNHRVLLFPSASSAASRVLGQIGFSGNGPNQIKPGSINAPYKLAIDYSRSPFALYVSDINNNRVLVWKDASHFRTGDPADLVIGQPGFFSAAPNADSGGSHTPTATSLFSPRGIAVAADGTLYVADAGNNRVLRFPRPADQSGRITPDAVLGQSDFTSSTSAAVNANSLHGPSGLAIAPNGDLFVADTGNNRVLEFPAGASTGAAALRVFGQPDFTGSIPQNQASAQTLASPSGLFVDAAFNLYVADLADNRVVIYSNTRSAPPGGLPASIVLGQTSFAAVSPGSGATGLKSPVDVSLDSAGNIFVSDAANNRVIVYPSLLSLPNTGASAYMAVGQPNIRGTAPNWNTPDGLATPEGLSSPVGVFVDRRDTLYVGDAGNNRVLHFLKPVAVVNGATLQPTIPVGLGAWCTLYGSGLAAGTGLAKTSTLPTSLAGREVVVNDQIKAPLYYVSSNQINLVFPFNAPVGLQRIAARMADTGELLAGGTTLVAPYSPGFFTHDQNGQGQAATRNADNSINSASNPAARGSVVQLFGTGQGPVVSPVADGQPAPSAPDKTVAQPTSDAATCLNNQPAMCVALGGSAGGAAFAEIQYSGLAPGLVGVWQVNIKIPKDGLQGDTVRIRALIGGANQSNLVTIAVK